MRMMWGVKKKKHHPNDSKTIDLGHLIRGTSGKRIAIYVKRHEEKGLKN